MGQGRCTQRCHGRSLCDTPQMTVASTKFPAHLEVWTETGAAPLQDCRGSASDLAALTSQSRAHVPGGHVPSLAPQNPGTAQSCCQVPSQATLSCKGSWHMQSCGAESPSWEGAGRAAEGVWILAEGGWQETLSCVWPY